MSTEERRRSNECDLGGIQALIMDIINVINVRTIRALCAYVFLTCFKPLSARMVKGTQTIRRLVCLTISWVWRLKG